MPTAAGMMCTIDEETFLVTKNTWIGYLGTTYHITNNDTGLYDVTNINQLVQGSSSSMLTAKKGKLLIKECQVDGRKKSPIHKAGTNLFLLMHIFAWEQNTK